MSNLTRSDPRTRVVASPFGLGRPRVPLLLAGPGPQVAASFADFVEHVGSDKLVGIQEPTGASVDVQGKVWLVDQSKDGGGAFVYTPMTKEVKWVGGLNGPYTYSDMTGYALKNVAPQ